jgi:hypothetical protein
MNKSQKQTYWFKRKEYGYGWMPATWQGWSVIVGFFVVLLAGTFIFEDIPRNTFSKELGLFAIVVAFAVAGVAWISLKKGPSPSWNWKGRDNSRPKKFKR